MFSNLSRYILKRPITILSFIVIISTFFFYYAFLSEQKLKVDFSLEQLFPNRDSDRDYYDNGKIMYDGEWKDDERHGQGTFYYKNGKKIYSYLDESKNKDEYILNVFYKEKEYKKEYGI